MENKLYDIELEKIVLGAIILEDETREKIAYSLDYKVFYEPMHVEICKSIISLMTDNKPVEILTLTLDLKAKDKFTGTLNPFYISRLTSRIASTANNEFHYRLLQQLAMKRELSNICRSTERTIYSYNSDIFDVIDDFEKNVTAITDGIIQHNFQSSEDLHFQMIERNKKIIQNRINGIASGVASGFDGVDQVTGGWQKSDLVILAARPSMGKTAFALTIARNAAVDSKKPVAVFSLEMSSVQCYARLQAGESDIDVERILKRGLDPFEQSMIYERCNSLLKAPIYIDDTAGLTVFQLRNKARRLKREKKIELIVIDYLQLMSSGERTHNREAEISYISRSLKKLAKELDIPIIALSQLSRDVEKRPDKVPQLSDLRESGAIEQDADIVMFIYRPEYYKIMTDEAGNSTEGKAMIIIAKHRSGSLGDPVLNFQGRITKFSN